MEATAYLTSILSGIVNHPEVVAVNQTTDEMGVLLSVSLHKEDMGIVIGTKGETAKAIRRLLKAHGHPRQQHISMKILEPA